MSRIKIDIPSRFVFSTQIPIRIDDINYGSHLGHDSVLTLTHEARVRFLTTHGYTEDNIEGVGIIMGDVGITYSSEAFYGDVLEISIGIGEYGNHFCELVYVLVNEKSGKEVARVKTSLVFFDYKERKTVRMPEEFRRKIIPETE
ncbi:MAG: thioesterase [Candidatus Dadabacteria bacterium]|nr:thioesterase [Candidatus Dadabacteria bacterium]MYA48662.1 thioesterase [Candidatus Dadabacteria bacterium]MYF48020.1 thioesterase [Candidatus Dadabacteria bacterium]MYG82895.1 thioesterase [Candidatus Dadabacteria bacterium]MYK48709.1 thioesterase [Candidatus Dadabacteria bacterium]